MSLGHDKGQGLFQGIPGIYLLLLCDVIKQFGLDEQVIIHDMGVTRGDLLRPDSRITMKMGHLAAQRSTALAGDLGLGMAYAQALKVTLHGSVGLVAMTSPTIGAALEAMSRFIALRAPFFKAAFENQPLPVHGDGSQTRSLCYVDDEVEGILRLLLSDETEPVNIGNPEEVTVLELAETIQDVVGNHPGIDFRPRPTDDPNVRRPDTTRAEAVLGWKAQISLRAGLERTMPWFKEALGY